MESDLTKTIKKRLRAFKPQMPTYQRTIRWAEEVTTGTGYVDVIRFEDYVEQDNSFCSKASCKVQGRIFPNPTCRGCLYKRTDYVLGILTTCYEVKISISDFKNKNGHNFCGNHNYYAIPIEIYEKVKRWVPADIGILAYYTNSGTMLIKKRSKYQEITKESLAKLIYNAMKKWVDKYS